MYRVVAMCAHVMRQRRTLAAAGVLIAACLAIVLALHAAPASAAAPSQLPSSDPFYAYTGSTPLADISPGTVLKTRSIQVVIGGIPAPNSAEQVLYRTTGELGQPTASVATIIKPLTSAIPVIGAATTKLVSYQTFYDALGSQCDPSYTLQGGNSSYQDAQIDAGLMQPYLAAGDTVVTADYEGEGLDWASGQESGYNTLDAIRAAENYLSAPRSTSVGMVGYSGGSIATDWAAELQPAYAPDLNIVGTAEGGVPVDFAHNLNYINGDTDGWAGVIPAVLVGVSRGFGLDLSPFLSDYGAQITHTVSDQCINDFAASYNGLTIQQLLKPAYQDFLSVPTFASIVNTLEMGTASTHPQEPMLMGVGNSDGTGDGVMVAADVEALAHKYCTEGVPVSFTQYTGATHEQAIAPFESSALAFLQARLLDTPAVNGCALIGTGNSLAPLPITAPTPGSTIASCPVVTGKLSGGTMGLVRLGYTRAQSRRAYTHSSNRGRKFQDFFCLTPIGVRVGYASTKLLNFLPRSQRHKYAGRVVWASTSDVHFAVKTIRPGATVKAARRHFKLSKPYYVGRNIWYLAADGKARAIFKVRRGRIEEIGIADNALTRTPRQDRFFLRTFY